MSDGTDTVTDKVTVTITDSANTAPTVDAGGDQTVTEGSTVNLDGTATDPDSEDTLTYSWSHNSTALTITLDDSTRTRHLLCRAQRLRGHPGRVHPGSV